MAVANFQYITRMSSGFKVYILEGQPHLRSEDRYRHITNDRARVPTVYPIKRKRSHDRGLTLEERRERALSRSSGRAVQRAAPAPAAFSGPQSPTSAWSPTPSPTSPLPPHVYYTPIMDEPLALIKKPRKDNESTEEKAKASSPTQIQLQATRSSGTSPTWRQNVYMPKPVQAMQSSRIQEEYMRPSVITCVSSSRNRSCRSDIYSSTSPVISKCNYEHVVEEHFQRSLGVNYQAARSQQLSISVSVDDHFAKALGDKWLQIKSKTSSCSSTPPSSPSVTHSPTYSHSPNQSRKESTSSSSSASSNWSGN